MSAREVARVRRARAWRDGGRGSRGRLRAMVAPVVDRPRSAIFFLLAVAAFFTVGPLLRYCKEHRYFAVRAVEIHGVRRLDAAQVRVWLGMVEGSSIWAASPRELEARLEAQPAIARAAVRRFLPDRLQVVVREREPRALLRHGSDSFLVDRAGVIIGPASLQAADLPIITLGQARSQAVGPAPEDWMPQARQLRHAVAVARLLEEGQAGVPISEIALLPGAPLSGPPELVAYSDDGRLTLELGWGDWASKLAALRRVIGHVASRAGAAPPAGGSPTDRLAGTLDARDPSSIVARWARGGTI